ncbi:MAG: hypothetical protein EXR58_01910 [Chloroflexi bacterium]|nr:hypothetical protein [Chloroflexota bacterium]
MTRRPASGGRRSSRAEPAAARRLAQLADDGPLRWWPRFRSIRWPLRSWWAQLDDGWRWAIGILIVQRLVLAIVGLAALGSAFRTVDNEFTALILPGSDSWISLLSMWQRWDALWYEKIAEQGYQATGGSTNFSPLFPLLARFVMLSGLHFVVGGLLVSSVAFVVALRVVYDLALHDTRKADRTEPPPGRSRSGFQTRVLGRAALATRRARLTVLALALFPSGFFLVAPFTESLLLLLAALSLWLARRGCHWQAGLAGFLAALTHANGISLVFPLAYEALRGSGLAPGWSERGRNWLGRWRVAFALLPIAGAVVWSVYLSIGVGGQAGLLASALRLAEARLLELARADVTGARAQVWQFSPPWELINASAQYVIHGLPPWGVVRMGTLPDALSGVELLNLVCLLAFCGLGILALRWLPLSYGLFLWPNLLVLMTRQLPYSPLESTNRLVLPLFPCFMVMAMLLAGHPRTAFLGLAASWLLQLILFKQFVHWWFIA